MGRSRLNQRSLRDASKRGFDIAAALSILTVLIAVLTVIAVLVRLSSPGPILFRQERVGRYGRAFTMLKFRTMRVGVDDRAHREMVVRELTTDLPPGTGDGIYKPERDPRVTGVGAWLRRFSLDELPQLWNVVRGDMSIVGPRPSLPWEVDLFELRFRARELVRPGLTGLWQVSGRNRMSMAAMLEHDLTYVESRSFASDLRILARTPSAVLRGDGAR